MKAICRMKSGLWALALLALCLALPLSAGAEPAPASSDCQPAAQGLTLLDVAPELGQNVSPVVPPETQPAPRRMCSGDDCGCFEPSCIDECGAGNWPCINPCRRAQIQCAIGCCGA